MKLLMKSGRLKMDKNGNLNWKKYYADEHEEGLVDRGVLLFTFIGFLPLIVKMSLNISHRVEKQWQNIVFLVCCFAVLAILMFLYYRAPDWKSYYQRFEKEPEAIKRKWHLISSLTILVIIALYVLIWYLYI
jgi:Na+/H+ antiporter NhaD/arsenite permease-like protein